MNATKLIVGGMWIRTMWSCVFCVYEELFVVQESMGSDSVEIGRSVCEYGIQAGKGRARAAGGLSGGLLQLQAV